MNSGQYDGVVHAIGMLFAGSINRFASGSGSIPDPGTTYDKITRQTVFSATAAFRKLSDREAEVNCERSMDRPMRYGKVHQDGDRLLIPAVRESMTSKYPAI